MRPPCPLYLLPNTTRSILPIPIPLRSLLQRSLLCLLIPHYTEVLNTEVEELIHGFEGASDRYIVLEFDCYGLSG